MKRRRILIVLLLAYLCPHAQQAAEIDQYLLSAFDANKFNGVALVARNGHIILHKAYGWKDFATKTYNDTSTRFPILSMTKSFTAVIMLQLQEAHKLSLKDPLSKYLPEYPNAKNISLEQLLTHTSGIYNFTNDIGEEDSALVNHPVAQEQVVEVISKKPVSFEPGKGFEYNNSAYFLAGMVIEKATGASYWQTVRDLIFTPLGMNNSGFDFNGLPAGVGATGYQFLNSSQQKTYTYLDSTVSYSAGGIYSTTGDLYKFTQAIAKQELLTAKSWKNAFTRRESDFGIGFRVNEFLGHRYVKHSGGYPGFVSEFVYYPKEDITIILLKNSGNYGQDVWPITMGISGIVLGLPYDLWKARNEVKLSETQLREVAGKYKSGKLVLEFEVKDNQLYMKLPGGAELSLLAENEHEFYLENFNTALKFEDKGAKGFAKLILHEHGKDETFFLSEP